MALPPARWYGFLYPLILPFFGFVILRAVLLATMWGGIFWRGTFYPLGPLRANRVE